MFSSQDSIDFSQHSFRGLSVSHQNPNEPSSPARKVRRGGGKLHAKSSSSSTNGFGLSGDDSYMDGIGGGPNPLFGIHSQMSQDSIAFSQSQFSQNFSDRMGMLNMYSDCGNHDDSMIDASFVQGGSTKNLPTNASGSSQSQQSFLEVGGSNIHNINGFDDKSNSDKSRTLVRIGERNENCLNMSNNGDDAAAGGPTATSATTGSSASSSFGGLFGTSGNVDSNLHKTSLTRSSTENSSNVWSQPLPVVPEACNVGVNVGVPASGKNASNAIDTMDTEKPIAVAPPLKNSFLMGNRSASGGGVKDSGSRVAEAAVLGVSATTSSAPSSSSSSSAASTLAWVTGPHCELYLQRDDWLASRNKLQRPSQVWVSAFKEHPRIVTEFEEMRSLGQGTFSTVLCMRNRLDGHLYAVKRLKESIVTQRQGQLLLREVHALAALQGCPQMIRYHSCWIDNHKLFIQTELCHLGSLDDLVGAKDSRDKAPSSSSSSSSIMNVFVRWGEGRGSKRSSTANASARTKQHIQDIENERHCSSSSFKGGQSQFNTVTSANNNSTCSFNSFDDSRGYSVGSTGQNQQQREEFMQISSTASNATAGSFSKEECAERNRSESFESDVDIQQQIHDLEHQHHNSSMGTGTAAVSSNDSDFAAASGDAAAESQSQRLPSPLLLSNLAEYLSHVDSSSTTNNAASRSTSSSSSSSSSSTTTTRTTTAAAAGVREDVAWLVLFDISRALAFMHRRDMVHLDLRPANIFLTCSASYQTQPMELYDPQRIALPLPPVSSSSSTTTTTEPMSIFSSIQNALPLGYTGSNSSSSSSSINNNNNNGPNSGTTVAAPTFEHTSTASVRRAVEHLLVQRKYVMKLGDFGHCCMRQDRHLIQEGETRYCARELINLEDLKELDPAAADMFSLGASVYELCLGRPLGSDGEAGMHEWHNLRDGRLDDDLCSRYSPQLVSVLTQLLHPDPMKRPQAVDLVEEILPQTYVGFCFDAIFNTADGHKRSNTSDNASNSSNNSQDKLRQVLRENADLRQQLQQFKQHA